MFRHAPHLPPMLTTTPLAAWADAVVESRADDADGVMADAAASVPVLSAWRTTPQSARHHAEGPVLADHVRRMLSVLFAIADGADLLAVEEFASEKDLRLDVLALATTLRTHRPLLTAFALVHDVAKPETAFFDAKPDTKGAAEGFIQHGLRGERKMTDAERHRYDKLLRAFAAAHPSSTGATFMGSFFDAYGITVHYDRHDAVGASAAYAALREAVVAHLGLPLSQGKMLAELIRWHIDTINAFTDRSDAAAYAILAARAGKAGLNVDLFLDLALAVLFLDAVAGSVQYDRGAYRAQTALIVNMLLAEREAAPKRHAARELAEMHAAKRDYKAVLAEAGLDGDHVFALLGTPLGPIRGDVMRRVQAAIDDPSAPLNFGAHNDELSARITRVRDRLASL